VELYGALAMLWIFAEEGEEKAESEAERQRESKRKPAKWTFLLCLANANLNDVKMWMLLCSTSHALHNIWPQRTKIKSACKQVLSTYFSAILGK